MLTNSLSGRGRGEGEAKSSGQRRQGARGKLRTCQWPLGQPFLCSKFERGTAVPRAGSKRWIRHSVEQKEEAKRGIQNGPVVQLCTAMLTVVSPTAKKLRSGRNAAAAGTTGSSEPPSGPHGPSSMFIIAVIEEEEEKY